MKSLWDVNLDDTEISTSTLVWLGNIRSLRRLSLNRTRLSQQASEKIGNLTQLSELQLAHVEIDKKQILPLLQANNIESLNLSGWQIDDEIMNWLLDTESLKMLTLHDCRINQSRPTHGRRRSHKADPPNQRQRPNGNTTGSNTDCCSCLWRWLFEQILRTAQNQAARSHAVIRDGQQTNLPTRTARLGGCFDFTLTRPT